MRDIDDYAIIGNCRSAALISREGSLDWLCWPRFDSPSIFGAILDDAAGRWALRPTSAFEATRAYAPDTNVLRTELATETGVLRITDLMPILPSAVAARRLSPEHEVLRIVECVRGEVELEMLFAPRPDYGRGAARLRDAGRMGLRVETRDGLLTLRTDLPLTVKADTAYARARLRAGQARFASLTYTQDWPAVLPPLGAWSWRAVRETVQGWRAWLSGMTYDGPWRAALARSALTLKLLVFAPSGAVIAAPTTSLPERLGGGLNWDYRFCWLRDAALTLRALFGLGFRREAEAFLTWLLHATRLTRPELKVLYDVFGKTPRREEVLAHLSGHGGSRPVRIGNGAVDQLQLDIYGEVLDAATLFVRQGGRLDRETQQLLCGFGDFVCRHWFLPDEGIWEPRSGRRHHTHSKVLCWVALDRLIELHRKQHLRAQRIDELVRVRKHIRHEIEEKGFSARHQSYVAAFGADEVDAALLLLPWYRFSPATGARMRATYARIQRELGAGDGLLFRYRSPISAGEGAFGVCSFWGAEYLALAEGDLHEAMSRVEGLLALRNDVGLYAEEIDPRTGRGLGNFPQAFTHVGLINAALTVRRRLEGREPLVREVAPRAQERHA